MINGRLFSKNQPPEAHTCLLVALATRHPEPKAPFLKPYYLKVNNSDIIDFGHKKECSRVVESGRYFDLKVPSGVGPSLDTLTLT